MINCVDFDGKITKTLILIVVSGVVKFDEIQ